MLDRGSADDLLDATVYDTDDNKIGSVGAVYLDDDSGHPEWVTVNTGLFGTTESFLPLGQARLDGERLIVPIAKDAVKNAPHIDPETGHLSLEEEQQLYRHYGLSHGEADEQITAYDPGPGVELAEAGERATGPEAAEPASAPAGQPRIAQPGLRLRRHLVTEQQQITVPVVREEYILEPDDGQGEPQDAADGSRGNED